jgi:hyperosmotically inducible protein
MKNRHGLLLLVTALASVLAMLVAGCDKATDATGAVAPATTVGVEIDDSVVTSAVKSALLTEPNIKSFDFKVETRKGEVMLSGFVDNQAQLDAATALVRAVAGVKSIQNNVSLKGAASSVGNKVDDGIVTTKVKAALLGDAHIKSLAISVVTRQGEVQLSGFVDNQGQIDRALEVTRGIEGVSRVSNEMSVKK